MIKVKEHSLKKNSTIKKYIEYLSSWIIVKMVNIDYASESERNLTLSKTFLSWCSTKSFHGNAPAHKMLRRKKVKMNPVVVKKMM